MTNEGEAAARVKAKVRELGFDKVGIVRSGPLQREAAGLTTWLARGFQARMAWMDRNTDKRLDPGLVLPGARSVVVVAMNYFVPVPHQHEPSTGKISRYAWGTDYHDILTPKLEQLLKWMSSEFPSSDGRVYVDTGPVMEKAWAQRAGIGWLGKHTNIITRDLGSWVFLGELITTVSLQEDTSETDHCGTCTLCIDACPTGAIVEPYVVDSNRCLSYLTIEHRGAIEGDVTNHFDGWIYGCDVCQDVCPWNLKFSEETAEKEFSPREGNIAPSLDEWGDMSREEYSRRFQGSPIKRAKFDGLMRNIGIVRQGTGKRDPSPGREASHRKDNPE